MRQITVKYEGICAKCGEHLQIGGVAMYEKTTGIFCVGCEPTEVEEIRTFRMALAQRKAGRKLERAERLDRKAESASKKGWGLIKGKDRAYWEQPVTIPGREKLSKKIDS